ncbi:hypothetical protein WUBG_10239, partial [Wuchereria bancrofti]
EKSQQEEADRSAKSQQEILDYQNRVQKLAKMRLVSERYEKIQDVFTKERSHTDRVRYASCPGKESFQDIYKLIQADKKIAQSVDTAMFEHINKIEKSREKLREFLVQPRADTKSKINSRAHSNI